MTQALEHVIDVISRQPSARSEADVSGTLPWLRRRTELMAQLDKGTVVQLVRDCGYQSAERDDVLIQQGEVGERMYIILRGSISVYIDASLTGEEPGDPFVTPAGSPTRDSPDGKKNKQLERAHYGKFIIKYDSGKHFGEAALVGEDKTRNATIMADEDCDLLVIDQHLFDRCLKEQQERELLVMKNFVEKHPIFSHMSPKYKRLLQLSLRRENFAFGTPIITQGERHKALYFILSGQANVQIEPGKHQTQYSHLWPFEVGSDIYSQEFEWLRESRRARILRKYEDPAVWPTKPDSLVLRRTEGYAASERSIHDKTVCLCSIQQGEILGDTELVQNLSTYMQTVICTANTETLVLDVKNLDRVTGKRNALTLQLLRQQVMEKMELRHGTHHGQQVPFLHFVYAKLTEQELPEKKALPPLKTTKTLPAKEVQTQHMIESYLAGNSELLEPCVPGTLIYKDMMQERARIRSNVRRRSHNGVSSVLRETRRKMNRRKPRSRREIVDSLKEMIEAELVEGSAEGPQGKNHNANASGPGGRKPAPPVNSNHTQRKPSITRNGGGGGGVPGRSFVTDLGQDNGPRRASLNNSDGDLTPRRLSLTENDGNNTPRRLSLTLSEGGSTTPRMPSLAQKDSPGNAPARKSSLTNKAKSGKNSGVKKRVTLPPIEGDSKAPASKNTPRSRSNSKADISLPQILEEREETMVSKEMSDLSSAGGSAQSRYVKREVRASSDGPTPPSGTAKRLPPLAKVEVRRPEHVPSRSWKAALRFVNDRMHDRFTEQLLSGGSPSQQDYETSEGSLQLLESRIKQFHVKYGQSSPVRLNLKLPKLRRYKLDLEDEEQHLPKPGGKVWIKKRMCQIANSKFKVKGHEHIRYHMVPELPEFDKVKKMQTVMQQLMDSSVLKKQGKEAGEQGEGKTANPHPPSLPNLNEHRASFVGEY